MITTNVKQALLALGLAVALCGSLGQPAHSQNAKGKLVRALDLDAGPSSEEGPDPLTPQQVDAPVLLAPGAPAAAAPDAEAMGEVDPIVTGARQRLAAMPSPRAPGDREDQAAVAAFYAAGRSPVWAGQDGFTARARHALAEIKRADTWGLRASAFELPVLAEAADGAEALADAEVKLSLAVLRYARHARGGRLEPSAVSRKFDQKPRVYDPHSVLRAIAVSDDAGSYLRGLHPKHEPFSRLQQALMSALAAPADSGSAHTIRRIVANMERWRWMPDELGDFHVWNSVPEQMTRVVDKGRVVLSERIVVGRSNTPTPVFSADMQFIIFHPSWGVPPGMKASELWPQLRNTGGGWFSSKPLASAVLASHGLHVSRAGRPVDPDSIDWANVDIRGFDFVQPPGPRNVLGIVKFRFPNRHDVYMHDTPERHLFGGAVRAFSHGCMRVQNPVHLAEVLLAKDKGWSAGEVQGYVRRGGEIRLTRPIPVHTTYFTVVVDDDGKVATFADVYGLDARVASALEGQSVRFLPSAGPSAEPGSRMAKAGGRAKSRPSQKSEPPSFNPLAALFGN
ncbi:MAG: L,D-transpeptidase family protein [Hyphomonadaceae bacterium]|nr:L,D-transpeptidase family protein [Hyphomonadaceae bacterium]